MKRNQKFALLQSLELFGKSESSSINYNVWNGGQECALTTPTVLYSALEDISLTNGITLYSDAELTTPTGLSSFYIYYDGNIRIVTITLGIIVDVSVACTNSFDGVMGLCGSSGITVYTRYDQPVLQTGVTLYSDNSLSTLYLESYFTKNGIYYSVDVNGMITGSGDCLTEINITSDCFGNSPSFVYINVDPAPVTLDNGTFIYLDQAGNSQKGDSNPFVYNGYQYNYSTSSGTSINGACST